MWPERLGTGAARPPPIVAKEPASPREQWGRISGVQSWNPENGTSNDEYWLSWDRIGTGSPAERLDAR